MPGKLTYAAAGALVGGLLVLGYSALTEDDAMDEDRPPIIVKGGSLIFESGDASSSDPDESTGKPWVAMGSDWQPDHPRGKKTKWFSVNLVAADQQQCPALSMTKEITITYQPTSGSASTFRITIKGRPGNSAPAPAVEGSGLTPGGSPDNPQLIFAGAGTISNVQFQAQGAGNVNCPTPTSIKVYQF